MELYDFLDVLRRQAWVIAVVTLLAVASAGAFSFVQEPVYRAGMKIVVGQEGSVLPPSFGGSPEPFTQTMSSLLESDIVARTVIERLGLDLAPGQLLAQLHSSSRPQSAVLDVTYDSTDRTRAVQVLNAVGAVFPEIVNGRLERTSSTTDSAPVTVTVFDPARLKPGRVAPRTARNLGFAGGVGFLLGVVLAFVRDGAGRRSKPPIQHKSGASTS